MSVVVVSSDDARLVAWKAKCFREKYLVSERKRLISDYKLRLVEWDRLSFWRRLFSSAPMHPDDSTNEWSWSAWDNARNRGSKLQEKAEEILKAGDSGVKEMHINIKTWCRLTMLAKAADKESDTWDVWGRL